MMGFPTYENHVARMLLRGSFFRLESSDLRLQSRTEHATKNSAIYLALQRSKNGRFLDAADGLWNPDADAFIVEAGGNLLYWDNNHLTQFGIETIWAPILEPVFETVGGQMKAGARAPLK